MGFGSSLGRIAKGVATGGASELIRYAGGGSGSLLGGILGGVGGAFTGLAADQLLGLNKQREAQGLPPLSNEQLSAGNVWSRLTPEQQKDMLINNPNIETALGSQVFDPLTNTIRLNESDFTKAQRLRQEGLASALSGSLSGELPSTDPMARFEEGRVLMQPAFKEQRENLEQQLADQGLPRGSEAFNKELNRLEQSQGTQLSALARESVQTSEAQRAARFNEISSLLGTQQVGGASFSQFQPQSSGLDLFGAEQSSLNRSFQAQQASKQRSADQRNALIGAVGSLGGAGIGAIFSDRTLKENIEKVGESKSGIPIYHFDYVNKNHGQFRYEGVMAQDLVDIIPEAIIEREDGIKTVNYDIIDVNFRRIN